jgi:hypothetical protein
MRYVASRHTNRNAPNCMTMSAYFHINQANARYSPNYTMSLREGCVKQGFSYRNRTIT